MSNTAESILADCERAGLSIEPEPNGNLFLYPVEQLSDDLRNRIVANKPELYAYLTSQPDTQEQNERLPIRHVYRLLTGTRLYRDGDQLRVRGTPTPDQRSLIVKYNDELLDYLKPKELTLLEQEMISLYLHDLGETSRADREYMFAMAARTVDDRVALLRLVENEIGVFGQ